MYAAAIFSAAALLVSGVAADFKAWAPSNISSCDSMQITWEQTAFPVSVLLVHSNDPCGDIVADLGEHNHTSMHWNATLPAGRYVLSLEDANGGEAWTESFDVFNSTDIACQFHTATASANSLAKNTTSAQGSGVLSVPASAATPGSAADAGAVAAGAAAAGPLNANGASNVKVAGGAAMAALAFAGAAFTLLL